MRVTRSALAALALWTFTSLPASAELRCDPRTADEWAARGLADGSEVEDLLDEVRRFAALRGLDSLNEARALLAAGRFGGDCRQAKRELLAAALNLASGRLAGDCCLDGGAAIRERLRRAAEDCHAERDCDDALRFLRRINDASRVDDCDDRDRDDDHDRDRDDDWDRDRDWRDGDGCCRPRSRGWWHRQCLGADRVHPTKGRGGGKGPGAHPHLSEEDRDRAIRRARHHLARVDLRPCEALDSKNLGGKRAKAEAEVAALALNEGAGYLEGCRHGERLLDRALRLLHREDWDGAWRVAHEGNRAKGGLRRCDDDGEDEWGRDEDDDGRRHRGDRDHGVHDDEDEAPGKSDGRGKGQGKSKGKSKSKGKGKKN